MGDRCSDFGGSELPAKIGERVERMDIIEALLVFTVAAFHLAVVP